MRKLLLAVSAVLVLASFTNAPTTTILTDIDGTLLQSYPVIEQVNGEYTIIFEVDAMTIVTSNTDEKGTHIHLVATGASNSTVSHTLAFPKGYVGFNSYFESNLDVASGEDMLALAAAKERPFRIKE